MTPTAPWRDFPDAEQLTIPVMKAGMTDFLITGDTARNKIQIMPGAGLGGGSTTVKIELPANWDKLMSERGYKPLADFRLHGEVAKRPNIESADDGEMRRESSERPGGFHHQRRPRRR